MFLVTEQFCSQFCDVISTPRQWRKIAKTLRAYEKYSFKKWANDCWNNFLEDLCPIDDDNLGVRINTILKRYYADT